MKKTGRRFRAGLSYFLVSALTVSSLAAGGTTAFAEEPVMYVESGEEITGAESQEPATVTVDPETESAVVTVDPETEFVSEDNGTDIMVSDPLPGGDTGAGAEDVIEIEDIQEEDFVSGGESETADFSDEEIIQLEESTELTDESVDEIIEDELNDSAELADAEPGIPDTAEYWCGHYYKVYNDAMTFAEADAACKARNGYLATITSAKEYNTIRSLILNNSVRANGYTIGGVRTGETTIGVDNNMVGVYGWTNGETASKSYVLDHTFYVKYEVGTRGFYSNGNKPYLYLSKDAYTVVDFDYSFFSYDGEKDGSYGYICEWGDPIDMQDAEITLQTTSYLYDGNVKQPMVTVKYDGITLEEGYDYTYSFSNNINLGRAQCTVTGNGRFGGEQIATFDIVPAKVSNLHGNNDISTTRQAYGGADRNLEVAWDAVEGVDGYILWYSKNSSFSTYEEVVIEGDTEYYSNALDRGTTYYVKVQAYKDSRGEKVAGEWSKVLQVKIGNQILVSEMWGLQNTIKRISYKYYKNLWGEEQAKHLSSGLRKWKNGICYGLVNAGIASNVYNYPEKSSYGVDSLYELASIGSLGDAYSSQINMSALDVIQYMHILQDSEYYTQNKTAFFHHQNGNDVINLSGLYRDIKACQQGAGTPISIRLRYKDIHEIMAVGIQEETDSYVDIEVYDCNMPGTPQTLRLDKSGTRFTGWSYRGINGSSDWGVAEAEGVWLSYFGSESDQNPEILYEIGVLRELNSSQYPPLSNEGSNGNTASLLKIQGNVNLAFYEEKWNLGESLTSSNASAEADTSGDSSERLYWISQDSVTLKGVPAGMEITLAAPYHSVTVKTSGECDITLNVQDKKANSVEISPGTSMPYEVTFSDTEFGTGECTQKILEGIRAENKALSIVQNEEDINVTGTTKLTCVNQEGKRDDEQGELVNPLKTGVGAENLDGSGSYLLSDNGGSISLHSSTNNDGVYDHEIDSAVKCAHTYVNKVISDATCTANGLSREVCSLCGGVKEGSEKIIPAAGHRWGAWTAASGPTVFAAGQQTRTCTVCRAAETRSVGSKLAPTLSLNAGSLKLKKGQKTSAFKVTGMADGDSVVSVKSNNAKLLKVTKYTEAGAITLKAQKKTGKAKLTITLASGMTKTISVKVQSGAVKTTKVSVAARKLTLKKGEKFALNPVITPITSQQKAACSSSNKKVAAVTSKGVITAKQAGTAKITVKSGSKKVTVKVKVTK